MLKVSTGLRNALLDTADLRTTLAAGFINIYAGAVPATADAALGAAVLLATISLNSTATGIDLDPGGAAGGVIAKDPGQTWSGVVVGAGTQTATFYRHVGAADTGVLSTTEPRIQGEVGTAGAELNLTSVSLTNGATQTIDFYTVALPTL